MMSGILNSGMVQLVKVACQFASIIVVSRLLPPSDFGLLAMVSPIYGFITLFQDLGLNQATVQKPAIQHDEVNAFFWINIAIGFTLTVIVIAISPLIGLYYNEPRVVSLTAAMGPLILVGSFGDQPSAILTRRMHFAALSLAGIIGATSGLFVSVAAALILKNYWALYCGIVASTVLPTASVWFASKWRPSFPRRVSGLQRMMKFGAGITISNVAHFIAGNADNALVGHRWGDQELGLYDRAYKLLLFPIDRIVGPVIGTIVPVLSRLGNEPERYRAIFLKTVGQLTLLTWPGILWAIFLSDTLVPALLGQQWSGSAPIFKSLAIAGLVLIVNGCVGSLFVSQGRSSEFARWSLVHALTCVTAFVLGLPYGAQGVAIAFTVSEYMRTPCVWWYATRKGAVGPLDLPRTLYPQILSGIVASLALYFFQHFNGSSPAIKLSCGFAVSYTFFAFVMLLSAKGRRSLKETLGVLHRIATRNREHT